MQPIRAGALVDAIFKSDGRIWSGRSISVGCLNFGSGTWARIAFHNGRPSKPKTCRDLADLEFSGRERQRRQHAFPASLSLRDLRQSLLADRLPRQISRRNRPARPPGHRNRALSSGGDMRLPGLYHPRCERPRRTAGAFRTAAAAVFARRRDRRPHSGVVRIHLAGRRLRQRRLIDDASGFRRRCGCPPSSSRRRWCRSQNSSSGNSIVEPRPPECAPAASRFPATCGP